jgi:tetratricopeptide (TPR) repeat protein
VGQKYNLNLATEFRIAAELLQKPSGTNLPVQIAESTGLSLTNGTGGCWELVDRDSTVLGLIMAINGRLVLAPTSWSRRQVLAAGGAVLLTPVAGLAAKAATASGGDTSPLADLEVAARLDYVMQHPRSVDMAAAAHLHERAQSLTKQYDLAASTSLLPAAGECSGQVTLLRKQAPDGPVLRELQVTQAQLATLMGQLVWDASQRRDHATAIAYYDQAIAAANRAGETTAEAYAHLRKSYVALYGEQEPQAGLRLAQQAATLADTAGSHALQGLALLHVGEGYAMLGDHRACEAALGAAEAHFQAMGTADPAHGLLSADRLGRIEGSCYLALGNSAKAGWILEGTARRLQGRHKSKAIVLGNLALANVRQRDVDQAATVLHRAIDLLEVSRGGGGLNVVSGAVRELRPWRHEPVVQDVHERLLTLIMRN